MFRRSGYLLLGSALVSSVALASDAPRATVEVQGRSFTAFVRDGVALAVPSEARAVLVRDTVQYPPDCALLDNVLTGNESRIESCKLPGNAGSSRCRNLRTVVDLTRFDPGTIGLTALAQGWAIDAEPPTGGPSADLIRQAVAAAVAVSLDRVHYQGSATPRGAASQIQLAITAGGTSWASRLDGFVDLRVGPDGGPSVTYNAEVGRFVTQDHALACGLAAGEVQVVWRQNAGATVEATLPGPFSAADLWRVYQALAATTVSDEADPIRRAVEVGTRIGVALKALDLAAAGDLDRRSHFIVNAFFRGDALDFEAGLGRVEVESRATGTADVDFDMDLPWRSLSAQL
jgi:hypothetical protein